MRVSVQIKAHHRRDLFALARKLGQSGISGVLEEAIRAYLASERIQSELMNGVPPRASISRGRAVELPKMTKRPRQS